MENPIKMDDLGVPLFSETSIYLLVLFFRELAKFTKWTAVKPRFFLQFFWPGLGILNGISSKIMVELIVGAAKKNINRLKRLKSSYSPSKHHKGPY